MIKRPGSPSTYSELLNTARLATIQISREAVQMEGASALIQNVVLLKDCLERLSKFNPFFDEVK